MQLMGKTWINFFEDPVSAIVIFGSWTLFQAEWMYSQSKGRQFGPGEQEGLVEYLGKEQEGLVEYLGKEQEGLVEYLGKEQEGLVEYLGKEQEGLVEYLGKEQEGLVE